MASYVPLPLATLSRWPLDGHYRLIRSTMRPCAMRTVLTAVLFVGLVAGRAAAEGQDPRPLPPPADRAIDFSADVKPILERSCARCHARGRHKGGFSIESRETLLAGGDNGPALVVGDSARSELIALVTGLDPDNVMPRKGSRLTPQQIGVLRAWI